MTLAIFSLFRISRSKQSINISMQLNKQSSYFFILMIAGLLFSLGPRLNFNGAYNLLPLPYSFLLKFIPLLEVIRAPIRWSFLFFLGLTYFSLISLFHLTYKSYYKLTVFLVFLVFVLEYVPFNLQTTKKTYINNDYRILKNICSKDKKVLLELPVTHLNIAPNIRVGLIYITTLQLSSTYHECNLVNGYSGYDLPDNFVLADTINGYISNQQTTKFLNELRGRNINLVKFNRPYFTKELKLHLNKFIDDTATQSGVEKISEDLYKISN